MTTESPISIKAPTQVERIVQAGDNLVELLLTGGRVLIEISENVAFRLAQAGISTKSHFFIDTMPIIASGSGFERQYPRSTKFNRLQPQDYLTYFPQVSIGLRLQRTTPSHRGDLNNMTVIIGKYPAVQLFGEESSEGYRLQEIRAEYPYVLVSPARTVLGPLWDQRYSSERRTYQNFNSVFENKNIRDSRYPQETVLDPKKWGREPGELLRLLLPVIVDAAGLTFTQDVVWRFDELNQKIPHRNSPIAQVDFLTEELFGRFIAKASQLQQSNNLKIEELLCD